jgi:pimeloyl-ACP methyl ester carboxylesterase
MTTPDTIVLIHGLWLTPLSWEGWIKRYENAGYTVLAPRWPGEADDVAATRSDPSGMNGVGLAEITHYCAKIIEQLDKPPILVGHSFGRLIVELLLDRGLGAAGVAISPAPIKGVLGLPPAQLKSALPVLAHPGTRSRTVMLTEAQFHYAFANNLSREESNAVRERYAVPGPGRLLFQAAFANLNPKAVTKVNTKNPDRAPLLLVGATNDHTVPASTVRAVKKLYKAGRVDHKEYEGRSHYTSARPAGRTSPTTLSLGPAT